MSIHRLGNQKILSGVNLELKAPPRGVITDVIDDLLWEVERKAGAGESILWDTLRLSIEPEREITVGLKFRAEVEMHRDDVVAGFTAMALAQHERSKGS